MRNTRRNEKGFTMVELIIVVAIMGIIGALLVPAYGTMSTKARLSTDISTVKTLKRTAESFKAEKNTYPATNTGADGTNGTVIVGDDSLDALNAVLVGNEYLEADAKFQTKGATLTIEGDGATYKLNLTNATPKVDIDKALKQMNEDVNDWLAGASAGTNGGIGVEAGN